MSGQITEFCSRIEARVGPIYGQFRLQLKIPIDQDTAATKAADRFRHPVSERGSARRASFQALAIRSGRQR